MDWNAWAGYPKTGMIFTCVVMAVPAQSVVSLIKHWYDEAGQPITPLS